MTPATHSRNTAIIRWLGFIHSDCCESPGFGLGRARAPRSWGLDGLIRDALSARLVDVGFLKRTPAGAFIRATAA